MTKDDTKRLRRAFKGFSRRALIDVAFPAFCPETSKEIEKRVCQWKLSTKESVLVDVFIELLEKTNITTADLNERIPYLEVLSVALNAERRSWTAFTLLGEPNLNEKWTATELETEITRSLRRKSTEAIVKVKFLHNIQWINIRVKLLRSNTLRIMAPLYCAVFPGEPYLFISRKTASDIIVQSVSEALGYPEFKNSSLCGYHLPSLLNQLLNKKRRPGNAIPISLSECTLETPTSTNYTQYENRKKYMDQLMGPNPPRLAMYVVEATGVPCKGIRNFPGMKGEVMNVKVKFKTKDTVAMLKDMGEDGILDIPPPSYVMSMLNTGKNSMRIQPKKSRGKGTDTDTDTSIYSTRR